MSGKTSICPEVYLEKTSSSICLIVNFCSLLDSVVVLEFQDKNLVIEIAAYGDTENSYDAGFPLLDKDGSPIYFEDEIKIPCGLAGRSASVIGRFTYLQTAFLKLCIESHRGLQMLESNPNLLWLILDYSIGNLYFTDDIFRLLGKKRKEIIDIIFGEVPLGTEKFISKIRYLNGDRDELELTKRSLNNPRVVGDYAHWDTIPIQALLISERFEKLSGAGFLLEVCQKPLNRISEYTIGMPKLSKMTDDTIRMGITLNIKNSNKIVKSCRTCDQLISLHDRWIELLNKHQKFYEPDVDFEPPSIIACEGIVWISSANALIREGVEMEHCIATYVNKVEKGDSIVFAVMQPERATLELKMRDGKYEIAEIKLKNNFEVREETKIFLHDWIRSENARLSSGTY